MPRSVRLRLAGDWGSRHEAKVSLSAGDVRRRSNWNIRARSGNDVGPVGSHCRCDVTKQPHNCDTRKFRSPLHHSAQCSSRHTVCVPLFPSIAFVAHVSSIAFVTLLRLVASSEATDRVPAMPESAVSIVATVEFDTTIFSVDSIKKAAYRLSGPVSFDFKWSGENLRCDILSSGSLSAFDIQELTQRFRTEVLDQDLRQKIAKETTNSRNVILAHVFSKTGLQGD